MRWTRVRVLLGFIMTRYWGRWGKAKVNRPWKLPRDKKKKNAPQKKQLLYTTSCGSCYPLINDTCGFFARIELMSHSGFAFAVLVDICVSCPLVFIMTNSNQFRCKNQEKDILCMAKKWHSQCNRIVVVSSHQDAPPAPRRLKGTNPKPAFAGTESLPLQFERKFYLKKGCCCEENALLVKHKNQCQRFLVFVNTTLLGR